VPLHYRGFAATFPSQSCVALPVATYSSQPGMASVASLIAWIRWRVCVRGAAQVSRAHAAQAHAAGRAHTWFGDPSRVQSKRYGALQPHGAATPRRSTTLQPRIPKALLGVAIRARDSSALAKRRMRSSRSAYQLVGHALGRLAQPARRRPRRVRALVEAPRAYLARRELPFQRIVHACSRARQGLSQNRLGL